jgi:hypothetical protein
MVVQIKPLFRTIVAYPVMALLVSTAYFITQDWFQKPAATIYPDFSHLEKS